jgi:heme/copper-type cytochrome/quinol oxidase subunit 1
VALKLLLKEESDASRKVGANPWMASGLEWRRPSPPPTENFTYQPVITHEPYEFGHIPGIKQARERERERACPIGEN